MTNKKAAPLRRCLVFIATANRRDKWRDQLRGAGIVIGWCDCIMRSSSDCGMVVTVSFTKPPPITLPQPR